MRIISTNEAGEEKSLSLNPEIASYKVLKNGKKDYRTTLVIYYAVLDVREKMPIYNIQKELLSFGVKTVSVFIEKDGQEYEVFNSDIMKLYWDNCTVTDRADGTSLINSDTAYFDNSLQLILDFFEGE